MNLEELCSWLSHQKGMMAQTYAKDLAKYIVKTKPLSDEEIDKLEDECLMINNEYGEDLYIIGVYDFTRAIEAKIRGEG